MSLAEWDFVPRNDQKLALSQNLGDALKDIADKLFGPHNVAKQVEKAWGLDRTTAKNVTKGVVGAAVVTRAVRAQQAQHGNAWALWDALGELIIGQSRAAWIAERLAQEEARLIRERDRADAELAGLGQMAREMPALLGLGARRDLGSALYADRQAGNFPGSVGVSRDAAPVEPRSFRASDDGGR